MTKNINGDCAGPRGRDSVLVLHEDIIEAPSDRSVVIHTSTLVACYLPRVRGSRLSGLATQLPLWTLGACSCEETRLSIQVNLRG